MPAVTLRRTFAPALLALLLVLSQQMGMAHALAHALAHVLTHALAHGQSQSQDGHDVKSLAPDQGCAQCLAFAQIGSALDTPPHFFPAARDTAAAIALPGAQPKCLRTVCVFQSRAPPAPA